MRIFRSTLCFWLGLALGACSSGGGGSSTPGSGAGGHSAGSGASPGAGAGGSNEVGMGGSSSGGTVLGGSPPTSSAGSSAGLGGSSAGLAGSSAGLAGSSAGGSAGSSAGTSGTGGTSPFAAVVQNCTGSVTSNSVDAFTSCQFDLVEESAEPHYYAMQISATDASGNSLNTLLEFLTTPAVGGYDTSSLSNHDQDEVDWHESGVDYEAASSVDSPTPFGTSHVDITSVSGPFIAGGTLSYYLVSGTLVATAFDENKADSAAVSVTF